jgi:hypothetical protein
MFVEPPIPQTFEWFIDAALRFENFLSACVGNSVRLKTASFVVGGKIGWLVRPRSGKPGKPHPQIWIACNNSQLATVLTGWFGNSQRLAPFENLIYGTVRGTSLFVETEFLALAQAIESFHRLTGNHRLIETSQFVPIRQTIAATVDTCCTGQIAARIKDSISFANELSFQNRLDELFARLPPPYADKLLGDSQEFGQALRQTRNYLTHPGTKPGSKVITDATGLFLMNQKLHALIRFLVLTHLGFPAEIVFEPIYYQSRQWKIL